MKSGWGRAAAARVALVLVSIVACAPAQADEHAQIAAERATAQLRFAEQARACRERFLVTACVDEARRERRQTLDTLRTRELAADELRRRTRAGGRQKELAEKAVEDARRESARAERAARAASSASSVAPAAAASASVPRGAASAAAQPPTAERLPKTRREPTPRPPRQARQPEPAAVRDAREKENRDAYERRRLDAERRRDESLNATLRRMSSNKPPAAPLPVPGAASAAAR